MDQESKQHNTCTGGQADHHERVDFVSYDRQEGRAADQQGCQRRPIEQAARQAGETEMNRSIDNEPDNDRTEAVEGILDPGFGMDFVKKSGHQHDNDQRGQNDPHNGGNGPWHTGGIEANQHRGIYGNGAGGHARQSDDMLKTSRGNPPVLAHFIMDHRDDGIAASKRHKTNFHKNEKQLPQQHAIHLLSIVIFVIGSVRSE